MKEMDHGWKNKNRNKTKERERERENWRKTLGALPMAGGRVGWKETATGAKHQTDEEDGVRRTGRRSFERPWL